MPYLSQITHTNKNTEEKVNFFTDYFKFVNIRIGEFKELQFENHLSLIDKSVYQIETNLKNSTPYLKNYLSNDLLKPDDFINRFPSAHNCCTQISTYFSLLDKRKRKWIIDNPDFLQNLKTLKEELENSMLDEALSSLISFLRCPHKLRTHAESIMYCTNILVSEFRYRNHSKTDILNVISKIMSKDINEFPFPKEITDQNHTGDYKEIKERFIENRNFVTQFNGIKNLFEKESFESCFVFRVFNISAKGYSEFKFKYDRVTFISPNHPDLRKIRKATKGKTFADDFFKLKNNFILAYIKEKYESLEIATEIAKKQISKELKHINSKLDCQGVIDKNFYLLTNDFINIGSSRSFKPKVKPIKGRNFDKLSNNLFEFLKDIPVNTKAPLEYFEHQFMEAYREKDVASLWQYLENVIPLNNREEKQVKTVVSNILILEHRFESKRTLNFDFTNSVSRMSINGDAIGLKSEEQYFIERNYHKINPLHYKKKIDRPFISQLLKLYQLHASKRNLSSVKEYYCSVLNEAYELRNMKIHKGVFNTKIDTKLKHIIPFLVMRFRVILLRECSNFEGENFDEMVLKLNEKAKRLLEE